MDRYYSEEKESQSVYSDFNIILLCVDISATRRGDLVTPTHVLRKRKLSSRSVLFRPPKKKKNMAEEMNQIPQLKNEVSIDQLNLVICCI